MERTLIIVKPDGVQRGLVGEVLRRFEQRGLRIIGAKFVKVARDKAETHYGEHKGKPFYEGLVNYITSGPVLLVALEGKNAIAASRATIGSTKPHEAAPGTIRGDLGMDVGRNLVHGSASPEEGMKEVANFFNADELVSWDRSSEAWIYE